jgi:hypothetical protein
MFTDELRGKVWHEIRQCDFRAFSHLLPDTLFAEAGQRCGVRVGRCPLNAVTLVWLGVGAALRPVHSFASVLLLVVKLLQDSEQGMPTSMTAASEPTPRKGKRRRRQGKRQQGKAQQQSKHNPHGTDPLRVSEEAFVKARKAMPMTFWMALLVVLGERFAQQHGRWVRWKHFRLLALDGTHVQLPNWKRLAAYFGRAGNGRSAGPVEARMVMLQLPLARLPWRYTLVPQKQGEATVAAELLGHVLPKDLVLMDQGFWSYSLFNIIQQRQAYFAIRLRCGVNLRTIKRLGNNNDRLVELRKPSHRWRNSTLPDTMRLRVIRYQIQGFRPTAVVTNILSPRVVSREAWVRLSSQTPAGSQRLDVGLYHRRWEIETTFRELKVTQGMEGNLRGRTPEAIAFEVAGHVLLYLLVRWLIVEAAEKAAVDPLELSFRGALRELLDLMPLLITASLAHATQVLVPRLLERTAAHRVAFRPGRHYCRPHDTEVRNLGNGRYRKPHKLSNRTQANAKKG